MIDEAGIEDALKIILAKNAPDLTGVKSLFQEYADFLKDAYCLRDFERELDEFPDGYATLLLARVDNSDAGAVGLIDCGGGVCEMKRLYVRPDYRGLNVGRRLCLELIQYARKRNMQMMKLETLPRLEAAIGLYKEIGFSVCEKNYDNRADGVILMELNIN